MVSASSIVVTAVLAPFLVVGEAPIPKTPYGFTYADGAADAPIQIDFFLDLLCPYSRDAYPNVTKIATDFPDKIRVRFHHFPLPYHRNAFLLHHAAQALVNVTGSDAAFASWAEAVYKDQSVFNENVSLGDAKAAIKKLALGAFPELSGDDIDAGLKNRDRNLEVRADFKYGSTRGVYGTPSIYLNGIQAFDDVDYDILIKKIKPLF
ncbi:Aste57867_14521 [Aphanomyces stellatus]|uniref:Aste57867_14521 protein n=1 Tax=Aphanomyces stellatus TaxID=120398 RepID=A0A485L1G1_9STRA|nr:hypothetical protein As57867_014467 [Aphanomyces stellatus]VFT91343.1 Aste57867_14521 [Aphanomyces stellatus]